MASIIQTRRDIAASWKDANPVLAEGEIAIEIDTRKLKIGDGLTAWNNLKYVTAESKSVGIPSLGSVYTGPKNWAEHLTEYADILFTTNMDKETLINNKNKYYVTLSRYKYNEKQGSQSFALRRQDDKRLKTNQTMYCWRYIDNDRGYAENDPRRYQYFYVLNEYTSKEGLFDANPKMYTYNCIGKPENYNAYEPFYSNYATCFNIIGDSGYNVTGMYALTDSVVRYPAGDITTFINNGHDYGDSGQSIRQYFFARMLCRLYKTEADEDLYVWCTDWRVPTQPLYGVLDGSNLRTNYVPKLATELVQTTKKVSDLTDLTFVRDVPYEIYYFLRENRSFEDFLTAINDDINQYKPNRDENKWYDPHMYLYEYPIEPIKLKDCLIRHWIKEDIELGIMGHYEWHTLQYLIDNDLFDDLTEVIFKYPYNSAELWLRFCGWQKIGVMGTRLDWGGYGNAYQPEEKNSLATGLHYEGESTWYGLAFCKRAFGKLSGRYRYDYIGVQRSAGAITETISFNLATDEDLSHNNRSASQEVVKKLIVIGYGMGGTCLIK